MFFPEPFRGQPALLFGFRWEAEVLVGVFLFPFMKTDRKEEKKEEQGHTKQIPRRARGTLLLRLLPLQDRPQPGRVRAVFHGYGVLLVLEEVETFQLGPRGHAGLD